MNVELNMGISQVCFGFIEVSLLDLSGITCLYVLFLFTMVCFSLICFITFNRGGTNVLYYFSAGVSLNRNVKTNEMKKIPR